MKKMRRLLAVLLASVMVLAMAIPAMAAPGVTPTAEDKAAVTVKDVEAGATVVAYQIVKANYNESGFYGYEVVREGSIDDTTTFKVTSNEITTLAQNTNGLTAVPLTEQTDGTYTADLEAGSWMVIVTPPTDDPEKVYNPMVVSAYYSVGGSDNTMKAGSVSANDNWTLKTENAYAKSTKIKVDKEIVNAETDKDLAIGDTVKFEIETTMPSYSDAYTDLTAKITDELSAGLELEATTLDIKVGGVAVTDADADIETTTNSISIDFNEDYIRANGGKTIIITYSATLTEEAERNFDPNTNTAKFEYTNKPGNTTTYKEDTTYNYTFDLETELKKVDEKGDALSGAEFTLTRNDNKKYEYTSTSDADGKIKFEGLDVGTYTLKETKAPEGYTLNDATYTVDIKANYDDDGKLTDYTVEVTQGDVSNTSTYKADEDGKLDIDASTLQTTDIKNTKLSELPSTGGIGTTIFTIVGIAVMVAAVALYFSSRRKRA